MATIVEGAPTNTGSVATEGQVVVGVPPAESLASDQRTSLLQLAVVADLTMLAPARLVLAFLAVLGAISGFVLHLVDVVVAARVHLIGLLLLHGRGNDIIAAEVVDVAVLGAELGLHLLDLGDHLGLAPVCLFLHRTKMVVSFYPNS